MAATCRHTSAFMLVAVALLPGATPSEVDGCDTAPGRQDKCRATIPSGDATSLLQHQHWQVSERLRNPPTNWIPKDENDVWAKPYIEGTRAQRVKDLQEFPHCFNIPSCAGPLFKDACNKFSLRALVGVRECMYAPAKAGETTPRRRRGVPADDWKANYNVGEYCRNKCAGQLCSLCPVGSMCWKDNTCEEVLKEGDTCWEACDKKQGRCAACPAGTACCREDWKSEDGVCDGEGGFFDHVCTKNPRGLTATPVAIPDSYSDGD